MRANVFYYFVHYSSTSEEINNFVAKNTIIAVVKLLKLITGQYLFNREIDDFLFCGILQAIRTIQKSIYLVECKFCRYIEIT